MIKNQKSFKIFGFLMIFCLLFSMLAPVSVYAAWDSESSAIEEVAFGGSLTETEMAKAIQYANKKSGQCKEDTQRDSGEYIYVKVKGVPTEVVKLKGEGIIEINEKVWSSAKHRDMSKTMQCFVVGLGESGASEDAIHDFMGEFEGTSNSISSIMLSMTFGGVIADLYKAYRIMEPFIELLNIVLGVGCVLLILLLMFSTVMDLAYIGLPVWREAQSDKNKKHPFGVSYEALRTVEDVEKGVSGGDGEYRNAYLLYFKRRALTYIILAICIMYLICGGISGIIGFVLNLTGGIVS